MADVFISYSKREPEPTKALAADLEARGYTTWWDTSLLPGDRFPEKIRQELEAAKAVIVIWGESSIKSEWVYAEAEAALRLGKLITVRTPVLDHAKVPLPFNGRNSELVTSREKLYSALETLGVKPSPGDNGGFLGWLHGLKSGGVGALAVGALLLTIEFAGLFISLTMSELFTASFVVPSTGIVLLLLFSINVAILNNTSRIDGLSMVIISSFVNVHLFFYFNHRLLCRRAR